MTLQALITFLIVGSAVAQIRDSLPDGFYEVEFHDGSCQTPVRFKYRQLDVCALEGYDSYSITKCTSTEFKTLSNCPSGCKNLCSTQESGPMWGSSCQRLSGVYSMWRTCGPAPSVLLGKTWLVETRSAYDNCTDSTLERGELVGQCFSTSYSDSKLVSCTSSSRSEALFKNCELFSCDGCVSAGVHTYKDVGVCDKQRKTFECLKI